MPKPKRVIAYIDGFNLYHSIKALRKESLKWVNLWLLMDSITRDNESLEAVKYFSAYATWKPEQYAHHRIYIRFLEHFGVEPVLGKFKGGKNIKCSKCGYGWEKHEEKETDVNIAISILRDGFQDKFDRAIIVTADSDLVPVISECKNLFPEKDIFVAVPPERYDRAYDLRNTTASMHITPAKIRSNLLPKQINTEEGLLYMPDKYSSLIKSS